MSWRICTASNCGLHTRERERERERAIERESHREKWGRESVLSERESEYERVYSAICLIKWNKNYLNNWSCSTFERSIWNSIAKTKLSSRPNTISEVNVFSNAKAHNGVYINEDQLK